MIFGADALGGKHYQKALIKSLRPGDCCGIFLRTFGDAKKTVHAILESGKCSELVVHLAVFDRSHSYPISQHIKQLKKDSAWLQALATDFPRTKIYLSPFCEHNHKAIKMQALFVELSAIAPSCIMLNSIWKGEEVPHTVTEIHLPNSKPVKKPKNPYTVSFDGFGGDGEGDFSDANIEAILARYPDALHIRYWNFRLNGKFGHADMTPIDKRKTWPDVHYLNGHRAMMKKREGSLTWKPNTLYKPFSDDHGGGPVSKDNKAMCIVQSDRQLLDVRDSSNKLIDAMRRVRPDHANEPKGPRYYSRLSAYQIGDLAEKNTGSRLIKVGNSPLTDADLRSGRFR